MTIETLLSLFDAESEFLITTMLDNDEFICESTTINQVSIQVFVSMDKHGNRVYRKASCKERKTFLDTTINSISVTGSSSELAYADIEIN